MNQRGDPLRMFSVSEAFKQAVGGAKDGKGHFWPVDEGSETFVMAVAGFTKEHGLDAASGTQGLFDEADTLDADESAFRGKAASESDAKILEPAIVAACKERGLADGASAASGLAGRCHYRGA
jgi:hypothetical protein